MTRDSNGRTISKSVKHEPGKGWGATVWFGSDYVTTVRRYYYRTRNEARNADISDSKNVLAIE